jgi:hypothetical protein
MLLRFHGAQLDGEAEARFPPERLAEGISSAELRDYLRGRGLASEALRGEMSLAPERGLLGWIARGFPVVVVADGRFVLVHGFDPVARWLLLVDPRSGPACVSYDELEAAWARQGRLMLVAVPRSGCGAWSGPTREVRDHGRDEQDEEDHEQHLRHPRRGAGDPAEAEDRGHEGDEQEHERPAEHGNPPCGGS